MKYTPETRENGDFNLTLPGITRMVFEDLDGNDLVGPLIIQLECCYIDLGDLYLFPTFGNLSKGAPAKKFEDFILVVEGGVEHFMLN